MTLVVTLVCINVLVCLGLLIAAAKLAILYEELTELLVKALGADILLGDATWKAVLDIQQKTDDIHQVLADDPYVEDDESEQPALRN